MGRPKGEEKERRWIPVRLLAEVDAILGREVSQTIGDVVDSVLPEVRRRAVRSINREPEVQRDTPAYVDVRPVQALTPGAEASKCGDCGRMMARPLAYSDEHFRTCGKWKAPRAVEPPAF
tara:strand:- start:306 stop:665 length:360 start_codon:yes stop_codon:yes gene_type:complete